jgi:hypothetical protein
VVFGGDCEGLVEELGITGGRHIVSALADQAAR